MLSIVIPCYNEADNASTVERDLIIVAAALAERTPVEIVFVDDGSTDGTQPALEALCARHTRSRLMLRVVAHDRNRGLGAALRTGFAAAHGDLLVTTDSDATYRFHEIPALLDCLTDAVDVVTASPYHPLGGVANVPRYRLVLSRGSSWIYRQLVSRDVHTYTALFRAYRRHVLESTPFSSDGFLAGTEILVNAVLAGYRVVEHPTVLHSRAQGTSKARLARTVIAHLRLQARILGARLGFASRRWVAERPSVAVPAMSSAPSGLTRFARGAGEAR
jgi:dolichol-phosphate mannosyltransferase